MSDLKDRLRKKLLKEDVVEIPNIPNTMNFWHGGNLDAYDDTIAQKNGRYEFGPGLYITTHYDTALKYAKGSRKLYLITVENGVDINDASIPEDIVKEFINKYVISNKKKDVWNILQRFNKEGKISASNINVVFLNEKAIKSTNSKFLREFFIENGIDYEIVDNAFGWGEKMMVLYNMKKIVNIKKINPKDDIETYDLH